MASVFEPSADYLDALSAIDSECRRCEQAINSEGTFYFDRGNDARVAYDLGGVEVGHVSLTDHPVVLRLVVENEWLIDDSESPREVLVQLLETWLAALKGGAQ